MATIRKVTNHKQTRYEVDLGRVAGKRKRRFVETKEAAKKKLRQLEKDRAKLGESWDDLEARKKWTILEVLREIEEAGLLLTDVWNEYKRIHLTQQKTTVEAAILEFLEIKKAKGWRTKYADEMTRCLMKFAQGREKRLIASVGHQEISDWIESHQGSAVTRQTVHRRVSVLFSWAERQGYIALNPMKRIEAIRVEENDPEIFTVDQCRRLIESAKRLDNGMLPYFALSLFLGVRPEECQRLTKDDIDLEKMTVTVSGAASKTKNRRVIQINEPAYRLFLETKWPADWTTNFRRRRTAIRKDAGIKHWPKDVLRHTAASHFHNIFTTDEATKQLGHSAAIMFRHYRQMVSKEDTKEWLEI